MAQDRKVGGQRGVGIARVGRSGWLHDTAELLVRLALLGVEAAEHAQDVAEAMGAAVAAAVLLSLGLGFLAVLLTVLLWDSHRLLALAVFTAVFFDAGGRGPGAGSAPLAWGPLVCRQHRRAGP